MENLTRHVSRCLIAGIVALLPIGGTVFAVVYVERMIAESWLAQQPFYFPGLGLLSVAILIYALGLIVTTVIGRWLWKRVDKILGTMPLLGQFYRTLKQLFGYGEGEDALFQRVVMLPSRETGGEQIALVTNTIEGADGEPRALVFVPGAPTPTSGRLVVVAEDELRDLDIDVHDAMKTLISVGKVPPVAGGGADSDPS